MRYDIRLVSCAFLARHGVLDKEERMERGAAFALIEEIVTRRCRRLIVPALEIAFTLAQRLAPVIFSESLTVRQASARGNDIPDHAEVSVGWSR